MYPALPRIVTAQRKGGRTHLCVEDVPVPSGGALQRCACGALVVQFNESRFGSASEWDEQNPDHWCRRCWPEYVGIRGVDRPGAAA